MNGTELQEHWIVVVELDDVVPRRSPTRPNLYVDLAITPPSTRFNQIRRSTRKTWYLGCVQKLREDLTPPTKYPDRKSGEAALKFIREKLDEDGFTVNRNTRVWQVYVLELDGSGIENPGAGAVYVGETALAPEIRLQQHRGEVFSKKGKSLSAPSIKVPIIGLCPELSPQQLYFSKVQAIHAEAELAQNLRDRGYLVFGGH